MLRAEVGRQGWLDVVPGILFSAIIWKLRQQSRQVVGPMQRLCGCAGLALPLSLCNYASSRTFWAVEHIGHSTFLPLLSASVSNMLQSARTPSPASGAGQGGKGTWTKTHGINHVGRVWGPKTEPRIWHPKTVPPLLPASVSVPLKGPKNGAAKPPTCPALVRKVSRANRSASCSLPLRSRHRRRHRATHLLPDLPTHTRRGIVAFKLVEAGSCVCPQPALPLAAASPCVRERLGL